MRKSGIDIRIGSRWGNHFRAGKVLGVLLALSLAQPVSAERQGLPAKVIPGDGAFASPTPRYQFAETLSEQEAQLATNPLMRRFAASRKALASDPYRPAYHFVSPESQMNDPHGLSFWQGRWHLFYQGFPPDAKYLAPQDTLEKTMKFQVHWGHAVSEDLIHWRDLPYAIYPGVEKMIFSGGTLVEKDRVIALYPGMGIGQPSTIFTFASASLMVATSSDPLLLNWKKAAPIEIPTFDPDIWKQGDTYYGVIANLEHYHPKSSTPSLNRSMYGHGGWPNWDVWTSKDLKSWKPMGNLLAQKTPYSDRFDDGACPSFQKIGDKYIMLYFSHSNGASYFLGDYEEASAKFSPYDHGRFNHGQNAPGGVHAPTAVTDQKGDVINILNIDAAKPSDQWNQILSLPQRLSLDAQKRLAIEPIETVESLRGEHRSIGETKLAANEEIILPTIRGNAMELGVEIDMQEAQQVQLDVLRSSDAQERTSIRFFSAARDRAEPEIVLDGSESSILTDVRLRAPERAQLRGSKGETLKLRIFIDRSVVEVFANGKQYLAMRVYPGRNDSLGVSIKARGGRAVLKSMDAWQMKPIWPMVDES